MGSDGEITENEDNNIHKTVDENSSEDEIMIGSDWNGSDEDDDEPEQSATNIERNGIVLKGALKLHRH